MDWKKVRDWLILLLLAADLILAGNIIRQAVRVRDSERTAVRNAVTVAEKRGFALNAESVLALPVRAESYLVTRDGALERTAALSLLGEAETEEPGGGVAIYQSEKGQVSFRRGGAVELRLEGYGSLPTEEACLHLLNDAGLSVKGALPEQDAAVPEIVQSYAGAPVFNCRLSWSQQENALLIHGRWLLGKGRKAEKTALSRGQLTLALCDLMESQEVREVRGLKAGYYLQSEDAQNMSLVPAWAVETENGQFFLNCLNGKPLNF